MVAVNPQVPGSRLGVGRGISLAVVLAMPLLAGPARAEDSCNWLGDVLPLPLPVDTPEDIAFKGAAERQYLIFNLLAGGKLAWQRGEYAIAIRKWETLLRTPGLDRQTEKAVMPFLTDARDKLKQAAALRGDEKTLVTEDGKPVIVEDTLPPATVTGTVVGGGPLGPGGAVIWLRRTDGPMPRVVPVTNSITQRDKTFIPHVLAVPIGSTVEFQNEDPIYHNVFSLAKPNDFDAGVRATGATFTRKFDRAGAVEVLCNIHATMKAYVYVVDSPYFAKARPTGAFRIPGVPPGRYEVFAWHEASSAIVRKEIVTLPGSPAKVNLTVGGDKGAGPASAPDKYGHKRQTHLGY